MSAEINPTTRIRLASTDDLPAINDIYNYYVIHSTATYQTEPSTLAERQDWFARHGPEYPVTVLEAWTADGLTVMGWGSLSAFHPRAAYRHTVEDSVYLRDDVRGRGYGPLLLGDLVDRAQRIGHHSIIGLIDADQAASTALHAKFGFAQVAHLKQVGHKFGRWLDVVYMQKMLI